jgi:hypothetical protein
VRRSLVLVGFGLCLIAGLAALMAYLIIDALTDGSPWLALGVIGLPIG